MGLFDLLEGPVYADAEILEKCKEAIASIRARKGEDIDKWAARIARDVVPDAAGLHDTEDY